MISNPFDITKAVDYTDDEIYKYWVDLGDENQGFEKLIKPDSLMPMIIVGSKGSGKTSPTSCRKSDVKPRLHLCKRDLQKRSL